MMWHKLKRLFHQLGAPKTFYQHTGRMVGWCAILSIVLLMLGSWQALWLAPTDYQQGEAYRILFVHVPAAWLSLLIYTLMATAAAIALIWRIRTAFIFIVCAAPIGAAFTLMALVTGSIWGKPMWGAWWVWDARLTTELLLLFMYLGIIALYNAFDIARNAEKPIAFLALIGVVNIPIIHFSVVWWNSLHQGATVFRTDGPAMPMSMLIPLLTMALAFSLVFVWNLLLRMRNHILSEHHDHEWVQSLFSDRVS